MGATVTNKRTSFNADTNSDYVVASTTNGSGEHQQHVIVVDADGNNINAITGISDGRKVVASAGTAETLVASTTACKKVDIQAETDNTGLVAIGGSSVVAAAGTQQGIILEAGMTYSFEIDDLVDIYVDATVSGDGVTFTYFT